MLCGNNSCGTGAGLKGSNLLSSILHLFCSAPVHSRFCLPWEAHFGHLDHFEYELHHCVLMLNLKFWKGWPPRSFSNSYDHFAVHARSCRHHHPSCLHAMPLQIPVTRGGPSGLAEGLEGVSAQPAAHSNTLKSFHQLLPVPTGMAAGSMTRLTMASCKLRGQRC